MKGTCIAIVLMMTLSGCASSLESDRPPISERSPTDLFADYIGTQIRNHCVPNGMQWAEEAQKRQMQRRLRKVQPWLDRQVGREEMRKIREEQQDQFAQVYFTGCPSEEEEAQQDELERRLLNEMARRARADARLRPPPAPRASDGAR